MTALPSGIVTFLFSDIEGSTWLLQHLGEDYDRLVLVHRGLLRDAWKAHHGVEVGTEGDSFFVAFADASDAVNAAAAGQQALAAHSWPAGAPVRVRMGLHTGEARVEHDDYFGLAVHEAARVAASAHGHQVIVTDATRSAVGSQADERIGFTELGLHRLKDLAQPMWLFQLAHPELPSSFPPPRTLTVMPNNFPIQPTPFIGREDDRAGVIAALADARVVTLTGAGGVGKTRLALQVAADLIDAYPDGAWLVDLAPIVDADLVASAAAAVLGVREQPGRELADTLSENLLIKQSLVVLDNCEHLIDACANLVHQLVSSCPGIKVLATSREALNVPSEFAWRLRSLTVPERPILESARRSEAVRLFVQRAAAVHPDFALSEHNVGAVSQVCRRLDGLPLAIELAAARVRSMSVKDIAAQLDNRFRLLTGGSRTSLPRQRTLEAAVAWSYDLLSDEEQVFFERLAVFAGGFTGAAAEAVCGGEDLDALAVLDLLHHLVKRSLLLAESTESGETRYLLLETLRQFGLDRLLARGAVETVRARHLSWAVAFAETFASWETGAAPPPEAIAEEDNFRTAIEWAAEADQSEAALRIIGSVSTGNSEERSRLYERLLPPGPEVRDDVAGRALWVAGALAFMMGDWTLGAERTLAAGGANARSGNGFLTAMSLIYEGMCLWGVGDVERARDRVDAGLGLAEEGNFAVAQGRGLMARGWLEIDVDLDRAEAMARRGIDLTRELPGVFDVGHLLELLGFIHCARGDFVQGGSTLADATKTFHKISHNCASHMLETAAAWAAMTLQFDLAAEVWGAAERVRDETQNKPRPWERMVQDVWLPAIRAALSPDDLAARKHRGRLLDADEALDFAERVLRGAC